MRNIDWLATLTSEDIGKLFEDGRCAVCVCGPLNNDGVHDCSAINRECDRGVLLWLTAERELDARNMAGAE